MKNNNPYYTLSIFMNLDVQRGLFVLYLLQLGITQGQIGILQSFLFFSCVALEIPSGLLADRYGRKHSLILGFLGLFISGIGFLLFSDFIPFALIFCLFGASIAMGSGADRALLYDNLLAENRTEEYPRIISRARAIGAVSLGLSLLLGGALQEAMSWNSVYIFFAISKLIGAIMVSFMTEKILFPPPSIPVQKVGCPIGKQKAFSIHWYAFSAQKTALSLYPCSLGSLYLSFQPYLYLSTANLFSRCKA